MAKLLLIMLHGLNIYYILSIIFVFNINRFLIFNSNLMKNLYIVSIIWLIILLFWFIGYIILLIKNIIISKKYIENNDTNILKELTEKIKFKSISFWILNIILSIIIFYNLIRISESFVFLIFPIIFIYIIFLGTSVFSIFYIRLLYKRNEFKYFQMIIHIILQLCFILDVMDIIYLKIKSYKYSKNNN